MLPSPSGDSTSSCRVCLFYANDKCSALKQQTRDDYTCEIFTSFEFDCQLKGDGFTSSFGDFPSRTEYLTFLAGYRIAEHLREDVHASADGKKIFIQGESLSFVDMVKLSVITKEDIDQALLDWKDNVSEAFKTILDRPS